MTLRKLSFDAIGTTWSIDVTSKVTELEWRKLGEDIAACIAEFDKTYSRFRKDSWVTKLAHRAGTYELPDDAEPLLSFYKQLYDATGGLVTPLIGQVMNDAGYDARYSLTSKVLSRPPKWEEVISCSGNTLSMERPALLDFGAAGKGYLVDIVGGIIQSAGITEYVINAGGDILHKTAAGQSIEVGLENPFDTSQAVGIVALSNQSLCASAGSRRAWGRYHHLINPQTLKPVQEIAATWAVADNAMLADGLATALFFVPPQTLIKTFKFRYAVLYDDMGLEYSKDLPVTLFEAAA